MKTGYLVSDAMTHDTVNVKPTATVQQIAKIMKDNSIGSVLIMDNQKLMGICTEQDVVRKLAAKGLDATKTTVQTIMDPSVKTINADVDIFDAVNTMREFNVRHLPVMHAKKVVGILTMRDIMKIEPQLFDLLLDKIEMREEERVIQQADRDITPYKRKR